MWSSSSGAVLVQVLWCERAGVGLSRRLAPPVFFYAEGTDSLCTPQSVQSASREQVVKATVATPRVQVLRSLVEAIPVRLSKVTAADSSTWWKSRKGGGARPGRFWLWNPGCLAQGFVEHGPRTWHETKDASCLMRPGPNVEHEARSCQETPGRSWSPGSAGHLPGTDTHSGRC